MAEQAGRERMSSVDTAWLRMDRPTNLMVIVGVDVFDGPVDYERLRGVVQERLLGFRRFRQRVEFDATGSAWWVDDDEFDLDHHLQRHRLGGLGGDAELQRFTAELAVLPLDPDRPLWQFHLVDGYKGTSAMLVRIHHCIADGIALVRVMLGLTDMEEGAAAAPSGHDHTVERDPAEVESNPWAPYLRPLTRGTVRAIETAGDVVAGSMHLARQPERLVEYAQAGGQVLKDAAAIALLQSDSRTSLKGKPGVAKGVAWNEPLPLDDVRVVCKALGASINDVLLSCVAGAMRTYLRGCGEDTRGVEIRAMVPVNLRPADEVLQLGNRFGLVPLTLPVGIANPIARVQEVRRRMDELKGGYQAVLAYGLLATVGRAPRLLQEPILDYVASKATAVMTNVPGPRAQLSLAGRKLTRMLFWVPQSGDVGLGVSILSYAGGVQFGVIADRKLCPHPQRLIDAFAPEFEKLVLVVAMLPPEMLFHGELDPEQLEHALLG